MKKFQPTRAVDDPREDSDSDSNSDESKAQCSYTKTYVKQTQPAKNLPKKTNKQVSKINTTLPFTSRNQPIMKKNLEILNANRENKISTPAAKGCGETDQGGTEILVDIIEDVINQNMVERIPVNKVSKVHDRNIKEDTKKEDHKPDVNKTCCETIVNDQEEDNLTNDESNDFSDGKFVVRKTDMIDENIPPIWKITNLGFLLKYLPFEFNNKLYYTNTVTFTGWIPRVMHHFYPAPISPIKSSSDKHIVEFHKDLVVIDPDFVIPTAEELDGVVDEAMSLAAEKKKLMKIQREKERLSLNNQNNTKKESHLDNIAEDPSITAGPSDNCSQPQTADITIVEPMSIAKRKSSRTQVKKIKNCCSQGHHDQRTKKSKLLAHAPVVKEVDKLQQISNVINPSDKFSIGSFIILKRDVESNNYTNLWKITNFKLLQRYCPFENDGQILYRSSLTYCSWMFEQKNQYYLADVSSIHTTTNEHILKLNNIIKDLEVTGTDQNV